MRILRVENLLCVVFVSAALASSTFGRADVLCGLATVTDPTATGPVRTLQFAQSYNGTDIRTESFSTLDGTGRNYDSVTESAHSVNLRFDSALSRYASEPLDTTKPGLFGLMSQIISDRDRARMHAPTSRVGKETLTYTVKDLAGETVNGFDTTHYAINLSRVTSGCLGITTHNISIEVWAVDEGGLPCPALTGQTITLGRTSGPLHVTREVAGDTAQVQTVLSMQPIKETIVVDNASAYALTLLQFEHSTQSIDPAVFSVPAGYREASAAAFNAAERHLAAVRAAYAARPQSSAPQTANQTQAPNQSAPAQTDGGNTDSDIPTAPPPKHRVVMPGLPAGVNIP